LPVYFAPDLSMPSTDLPTTNMRKIRSFVRRQGRMTAAQHHALQAYEDRYCLDPSQQQDFFQVFGRKAPLIMEIGFGSGESLAEMAAANPAYDYLGVEVHRPGVAHLLKNLEAGQVRNVRIFCHDALEILQMQIADAGLAALHLFFPDPWPKKKHHKRRIVQPEFIDLISRKLTPGGYFHAATDWEPYAQAMLATLNAAPKLRNGAEDQGFSSRPPCRTLTKFEKRGMRLGHGVWDLIYHKTASAAETADAATSDKLGSYMEELGSSHMASRDETSLSDK
jgi:tRNA (guanine-N7-)-methyltransferase